MWYSCRYEYILSMLESVAIILRHILISVFKVKITQMVFHVKT